MVGELAIGERDGEGGVAFEVLGGCVDELVDELGGQGWNVAGEGQSFIRREGREDQLVTGVGVGDMDARQGECGIFGGGDVGWER